MDYFIFLASNVFMGLGLLFSTLAIMGLMRFKTVLERQHCLGLLDTMGITCVCFSLALKSGLALVSLKPLMLAVIVVLFSAPLCYMFMQIIIIYNDYLEEKKK